MPDFPEILVKRIKGVGMYNAIGRCQNQKQIKKNYLKQVHFSDASIGSGFMNGIVFYNSAVSRPDLVLPDGNALGGLHCGDCIEVIIDGEP